MRRHQEREGKTRGIVHLGIFAGTEGVSPKHQVIILDPFIYNGPLGFYYGFIPKRVRDVHTEAGAGTVILLKCSTVADLQSLLQKTNKPYGPGPGGRILGSKPYLHQHLLKPNEAGRQK